MSKRCSRCKEVKPLAEFASHRSTGDGLQKQCRSCVSESDKRRRDSGQRQAYSRQRWKEKSRDKDWLAERNLKRTARRYKLAPEIARIMRANAKCAICWSSRPGGRYGKWHIDHHHQTGIVRGILCCRCNLMLGLAGEKLETLISAVKYLTKPRAS